jgi:hypothetical protein
MKLLLIVTAIIEGSLGIVLLIAPSFVFSTLFVIELDTPAGSLASRIAGAALVALAIACWQGRNGERDSASLGVVAGMLFYNAAVNAVLVYAGTGLGIQSPLLWPIIVMHTVLGAWCLLVLTRARRDPADA